MGEPATAMPFNHYAAIVYIGFVSRDLAHTFRKCETIFRLRNRQLVSGSNDAYLASTYDLIVPPKSLSKYRKWAELRIEATNHALKGLPEERSRYHLCWEVGTGRTPTMSR